MYKTWGNNNTLEKELLAMTLKKTNKAWNEEYNKLDMDYLCLKRDQYFAFYDVKDRKLLSVNRHKIWFSPESFRDDWMIDTKSGITRPWQYFIELYDPEWFEVDAEVKYNK